VTNKRMNQSTNELSLHRRPFYRFVAIRRGKSGQHRASHFLTGRIT